MLELQLIPKNGNPNTKIFPHQGYLGLTPVNISGTISTRLPAVCSPLPVKSIRIYVRCIESRIDGAFGGGDKETCLWERHLNVWEPAGESTYEELGDWSTSWSLQVPPEATSVAHSAQWLKEWKITWKLEAILEHKPIPHVGARISKAFALNLFNHKLPLFPPPTPPSPIGLSGAVIALNPPHGAFGPGETPTLTMHVKPDEPSTHSIKKVSVTLVRRIEFFEQPPSSSGSSSTGVDNHTRRRSPDLSSSSTLGTPKLFLSKRSSQSPRPFSRIPDDPPPNKSTITKIVDATCDEPIPSEGGSSFCNIALSLPKRSGSWDIGETITTDMVSITFELQVKVYIKNKRSTKESLVPGVPIIITSTSAMERAEGMASLAAISAAATKSDITHKGLTKRKHRSSRRGLYMQEGTVDIADPVLAPYSHRTPHGEGHGHGHSHGRRRRTRSTPSSPILASRSTATALNTASADPNVKGILLPADHPVQPQSISFIFPSPPPDRPTQLQPLPLSLSSPGIVPVSLQQNPPLLSNTNTIGNDTALIPIHSLLQSPTSPFGDPSPSSSSVSGGLSKTRRLQMEETTSEYESMSILRQYSITGRRISATTSEEDEIQPSRSKQKVDISSSSVDRPALPSLDALGLGLPHVPDEERPARRPRTAPIHSTFSGGSFSSSSAFTTLENRRGTSFGMLEISSAHPHSHSHHHHHHHHHHSHSHSHSHSQHTVRLAPNTSSGVIPSFGRPTTTAFGGMGMGMGSHPTIEIEQNSIFAFAVHQED